MYLTLKALNEDATLNTHMEIGSVKFVKDQALTMVLKLHQPAKNLRYIPEAASTLNLTLKKSDNTTISKVGTFPFADDRSIIKFSLTAVEMANVISQAIIVNLTEPVVGTSVAILDLGLQIVKPESC
jgi:hypothetical protein